EVDLAELDSGVLLELAGRRHVDELARDDVGDQGARVALDVDRDVGDVDIQGVDVVHLVPGEVDSAVEGDVRHYPGRSLGHRSAGGVEGEAAVVGAGGRLDDLDAAVGDRAGDVVAEGLLDAPLRVTAGDGVVAFVGGCGPGVDNRKASGERCGGDDGKRSARSGAPRGVLHQMSCLVHTLWGSVEV